MAEWNPKTRLGKMVLSGEITTMSQALATKLPLREPEIVDILLPEMKDEVIGPQHGPEDDRLRPQGPFAVTSCVGNGDGSYGLGRARAGGRPTIRKAS